MFFYNKNGSAPEHSGLAQEGSSNRTIKLALDASATPNIYNGMQIIIQNNRPVGIKGHNRIIEKYDATNKIATVTQDWNPIPTQLTEYKIFALETSINYNQTHLDLSNSNNTIVINDNQLLIDNSTTIKYTEVAVAGGGTTDVKLATDTGSQSKDKENFFVDWYIKMTDGGAIGEVQKITGYVASTRIATVSSAWIGGVVDGDTYILQEPRNYLSLNKSNPEYYGLYATNETDANVIPFDTSADGTNTSKILPVNVSGLLKNSTNEAVRIRVGDTLNNIGGLVIEGYDSTGTGTTTNLMTVDTQGRVKPKNALVLSSGITDVRPNGSLQWVGGTSSALSVYNNGWNKLSLFYPKGYIRGFRLTKLNGTQITVEQGIADIGTGTLVVFPGGTLTLTDPGAEGVEKVEYIYLNTSGTAVQRSSTKPQYDTVNNYWYLSATKANRFIGAVSVYKNGTGDYVQEFVQHGRNNIIEVQIGEKIDGAGGAQRILSGAATNNFTSMISEDLQTFVPSTATIANIYAQGGGAQNSNAELHIMDQTTYGNTNSVYHKNGPVHFINNEDNTGGGNLRLNAHINLSDPINGIVGDNNVIRWWGTGGYSINMYLNGYTYMR